MADKTITTKSVAAAVGVAFVSSLAASTAAADNPFELTELDSGYMLADSHEGEEGKCGEKGEEGACGEKGQEGKCGEGKCGADEGEGTAEGEGDNG
jgi:uncharacterized low-complexity protein